MPVFLEALVAPLDLALNIDIMTASLESDTRLDRQVAVIKYPFFETKLDLGFPESVASRITRMEGKIGLIYLTATAIPFSTMADGLNRMSVPPPGIHSLVGAGVFYRFGGGFSNISYWSP